MSKLDTGDKVQYALPDKNGNLHWFDGVVHGVRSYQDDANGDILKVTYLIDTGRDTRVDEYPFDHRDREINKRVHEKIKAGKKTEDALAEVLAQKDLPASKPDKDVVRQPEQLELPPESVRPA